MLGVWRHAPLRKILNVSSPEIAAIVLAHFRLIYSFLIVNIQLTITAYSYVY